MTIQELLALANEGYPDGFLAEYFDAKSGFYKEGRGDHLAGYVVSELVETFDHDADDDTQLDEAVLCVRSAQENLEGIVGALEKRRYGRAG